MAATHGLHHVTAVTATIQSNLKFYTEVLGLRLVKQTVNQDDVTAYHLFYADAVGTPGTDITFFDWSVAEPNIEGTDQISRTYFRVRSAEALTYWKERLAAHDISATTNSIGHRATLLFSDPEGQRLGFIYDEGTTYEGALWEAVVPKEYALCGLYAVELTVPDKQRITNILHEVMDWEVTDTYIDQLDNSEVAICTMAGGGPGKEVYVRERVATPILASLAGSVHHVAFRVDNERNLQDWILRLEYAGVPHSGLVDRFYFKSLYFRVSRGILFEIATDGPGFSTDEAPEHLGESLSLPPFLEERRATIEAGLRPLQ